MSVVLLSLRDPLYPQDSIKVPSGSPGQAGFLAGQVSFPGYLTNGQESRQFILEQNL